MSNDKFVIRYNTPMLLVVVFLLEIILLFASARFATKALSLIFFKVTRSEKRTIYLLSFLFLPGIILHELAHAIVASLLFVGVGDIEFMPKMQNGGVKLGSVAIAKTDPLRRFLIGIAPIVVGISVIAVVILSLFVVPIFLQIPFVWKGIILTYILFEIGNTMFSSSKDMEGALELIVVALVIIVAVFLLGFRIPISTIETFLSSIQIQEFLTTLCLFLAIPIALNICISSAVRFVIRK